MCECHWKNSSVEVSHSGVQRQFCTASREPLVLLSQQVGKMHAGRSAEQQWLIMARCHTMHVAPIRPIITGCSSRAIGTESARCEPNYMQHSHSLFHK